MAPIAPGALRFVHGEPDGIERDPSELRGAVSASFAGLLRPEPFALGYRSSTALTAWLGDRYDLAAVWGNGLLGVEGNLALARTDAFRLGLTHGLSGALLLEARDLKSIRSLLEPSVLLSPTAGLYIEWNGLGGTLFGAARYTHGFELLRGALSRPAHYASAALGYQLRIGRVRLAPQLIVIRSWWARDVDVKPEWLFEPGIGVGAAF